MCDFLSNSDTDKIEEESGSIDSDFIKDILKAKKKTPPTNEDLISSMMDFLPENEKEKRPKLKYEITKDEDDTKQKKPQHKYFKKSNKKMKTPINKSKNHKSND